MSILAYKPARLFLLCTALSAAPLSYLGAADLEVGLKAVDSKVIAWRRDFHQHPELSDNEVRTARIVADHLTRLGLEVTTGVAHNGVVGFLETGKPGPTIA